MLFPSQLTPNFLKLLADELPASENPEIVKVNSCPIAVPADKEPVQLIRACATLLLIVLFTASAFEPAPFISLAQTTRLSVSPSVAKKVVASLPPSAISPSTSLKIPVAI